MNENCKYIYDLDEVKKVFEDVYSLEFTDEMVEGFVGTLYGGHSETESIDSISSCSNGLNCMEYKDVNTYGVLKYRQIWPLNNGFMDDVIISMYFKGRDNEKFEPIKNYRIHTLCRRNFFREDDTIPSFINSLLLKGELSMKIDFFNHFWYHFRFAHV